MPEIAYVNGIFSDIASARVSIEDRGFQFGDGVYEVAVVYGGEPFLLAEHMARLRLSCDAIRLAYDFDANPLEPLIEEGLRRSGFADAMVYVQITRGVAPRHHSIPCNLTPTVVMTFKALPRVPQELRKRGAKLMTIRDNRWANCYVKATTLLPNVLAKDEALRLEFDDAVFVTDDGEVRECTAANIFIVEDGRLVFPPRNQSVLHGITQGYLLVCAEAIGLAVEERGFRVEALYAADEVFMSSTTMEVLGVTSVDGKRIADGRVGTLTKRLLEEFRRRARAAAHQRHRAVRLAS